MKSALKKVSLILAICFVAFHLYTAAFGTMPGIAQKSIHLGFLLVIFYINAMVDSEKRWEQIFLGIMALFALGGCAYITILDENLQLRAGIVYASDILFAILLIIAIFEACRRKMGNPLVIITLVFVAYAFLGKYIPGFLNQPGMTLKKFTSLVYLTTDGIFGSPLYASASYVVLFVLLAVLEDVGYMARIAFIMDRIFRRFGLSGKSFIPMLIGLGCGVPAVQASRTIENDRDRKMTIMTTTFIPCSAKLPIIGLIAGALFNGSGWVATSAYFVGIAAIIVSGIILKKTTLFAGDPAPFVMELPAYHLPSIKGVLIHMWDRLKAFVRKAGTIIFLSSIVIWFLSSFNFKLQMVDTQQSILSSLGKLIAPLFAPLGWGHWEAAVGTITGLVAKENVVATLGILFGFAEVAENGDEIWTLFAQNFTALSAYSFLVFNLLCAPCFAAIGAIRREMGSAKWTWIAIGYQCIFAYIISLIIFQLGNWFTTGILSIGTVVGILLLAVMVYLLVRPAPDGKSKKMKAAKTVA